MLKFIKPVNIAEQTRMDLVVRIVLTVGTFMVKTVSIVAGVGLPRAVLVVPIAQQNVTNAN